MYLYICDLLVVEHGVICEMDHELRHVTRVDLGHRGGGRSIEQRPEGRQESFLPTLLMDPEWHEEDKNNGNISQSIDNNENLK